MLWVVAEGGPNFAATKKKDGRGVGDCRLKMLHVTEQTLHKFMDSISTTFSLTKPDLSRLASKSETPETLSNQV